MLKNFHEKFGLIVACALGLLIIGCKDQVKDKVLKSVIILPPQNQEIWEGERVYFEGVASGGISPYTYNWDFGVEIPPSSKKKPGEIIFSYEGAYKVSFAVKDSNGNMDFDFVYVVVKRKEVI